MGCVNDDPDRGVGDRNPVQANQAAEDRDRTAEDRDRRAEAHDRVSEALRRRRVEAAPASRFVERLFGLELSQATFDRGAEFVSGIDGLVMGRATYDVIAPFDEWPYQGRPVHVLSRTLEIGADPRITVHRSFDESLEAAVRALLAKTEP